MNTSSNITSTWRSSVSTIVSDLTNPNLPLGVERNLVAKLVRMAEAADKWEAHIADLRRDQALLSDLEVRF